MDWWTPEGGTLLEWHPTAAAAELAGSALPDCGPVPFLQANHVRGCHTSALAGADHHAYLGSGTDIDGDLDRAALTRALCAFVKRHDGLRTFFGTNGTEVTRYVVAPAAVDFEVSVAGAFDQDSEFREYLHRRLASEASTTDWPGFAFGAISRPGGFTIYYGCDHALTDGASMAMALTEIAELYDSDVRAHAPSEFATAETAGFIDYARVEDQVAQSFSPDSPELREWVEIFDTNAMTMPGFPLDLGLGPGESAPVRPVELDLLDATGLDDFDRVCKASGTKLISGIFAAVAITEYELAFRTDYFGISVLNTRMTADFALSQGWFCAFAPVAFNVSGSPTFTDLLPSAQAGHTRAKRLAAVPTPTVLGALLAAGASPQDVAKSPNLLSYIDFRWFPGDGTPAYDRGVLFTGEGRTSNASMWFNRDHSRLYLGSQTPDTTVARLSVKRYHEHLWTVINSVVRDGDYAVPEPCPEESTLARHHD
ncbi:MAG TPA: condensation domain-containing protein [Williamsia sp.]